MSSVTNAEETYKVEPLQGSANYRTWKFSMRQARDLWEVVSDEEVNFQAGSGESRARLGEEGAEGLGNHCAGPVCSGERAHHRVHHPEGGMRCVGEVV